MTSQLVRKLFFASIHPVIGVALFLFLGASATSMVLLQTQSFEPDLAYGSNVSLHTSSLRPSVLGTYTNSPVSWTGLVNMIAEGGDLEKKGGHNDGTADGGARSLQQITSGSGYVEFKIPEISDELYIGLSDDLTNSTTWETIDFSLAFGEDGYASVWERGVYKSDIRYVVGDTFRVGVEAGTIKYYKNGQAWYTSLLSPVYPLVADVSMQYIGTKVWAGVMGNETMGSVPPPVPGPNQKPTGRFDGITPTGTLVGWAKDPNVPDAAVVIHFYIDTFAGAGKVPALTAVAGDERSDVGRHAFNVVIPNKFRDGKRHYVYAYALDVNETSGRSNVRLAGSPRSFTLSSTPPPAPPAPTPPPPAPLVVDGYGDMLTATKFDGWFFSQRGDTEALITYENIATGSTVTQKATRTITRTDAASWLAQTYGTSLPVTQPLGFSINPSQAVTVAGTYKIKSFVLNVSGVTIQLGSGASGTFTITASVPVPPPPSPVPPPPAPSSIELPRVYIDTTYVAPSGPTITVPAGGDLQAAIHNAQPGSIIALAAGATYTGNFSLPNKSGNAWIVITTQGFSSPQGKRVGPALASQMAKIVTPNTDGAIITAAGAHHYRFIGVEISLTANAVGDANAGGFTQYGLVRLGDSAQTVLANQAHDIILDRVYIHGLAGKNVRRGVALNSHTTAIVDSYISEMHEIGADSQAIAGWNGAGPYKIVNNYLEAAGENIIFGGADPAISNLVPSDMEIRGNYFVKPLAWRQGTSGYAGYPWLVKNLFELKIGKRILVDGNVFENSWAAAQSGMAINLKSTNQDGTAPWSITQDITISNNIIRHAANGITLTGRDQYNGPTPLMNKVRVYNNIFDDINSNTWGGGTEGNFLKVLAGPDTMIIDHNTSLNTGNTIIVDSPAAPNFTFTNNIALLGEYGIKGSGAASGTPTISSFFPGGVFSKNVLVGNSAGYPVNNFYPTSVSGVGFVNYNNGSGGNYSLSAGSLYRAAGTDGQDIGANVGMVTNATSCAISGQCP